MTVCEREWELFMSLETNFHTFIFVAGLVGAHFPIMATG